MNSRGFGKSHISISVTGAGFRRLGFVVPYTTRELTRSALEGAAKLVSGLSADLTLVAVQVVPFPCPLNRPTVDPDHLERELVALARSSALCTRILVVRARDRESGFHRVLAPESVVLLSTKRRWWRTAEERLARSLARAGHSVALMPA
jgi:hypothetical protein